MKSHNLTILGSLPDDLLAAGAAHQLTADFSDIGWSDDGRSVQLRASSAITFVDAEGRRRWRAGLRPASVTVCRPDEVCEADRPRGPHAGLTEEPATETASKASGEDVVPIDPLAPCVTIDPASWVRSEEEPPHAADGEDIRGPNEVTAHEDATMRAATASPDTPLSHLLAHTELHLGGCTLPDLLAAPAHRRLVDELVFFLAPARRTESQLLTYLFAGSAAAAEMRAAYSVADVRHVLGLLTRGGAMAGPAASPTLLELNAQGFALVAVERYESKRSKQLVANRAFAALAHAGGEAVPGAQRDAVLHALELYVDRDVVLAVRSGGGGIMAGLGSLKRTRPGPEPPTAAAAPKEEAEEEEDDDRGEGKERREASLAGRRLRMTEMAQCDIAWAEADLGALARGRFGPDTRDALGALRCWYGSAPPAAMPITSSTSLRMGQHFYAQLRPRLETLRAALEKHAEVLRQGRVWCEMYLRERGTPELRRQLRQWLATQRGYRGPLVQLYVSLQHAVYTLERDLTDYSCLHDFGVF